MRTLVLLAFFQLTNALALAALVPAPAQAERLFGVVSERNAADMVEAAARVRDRFAGHEIVLRTPGQLARLDDDDVAALWQDADAVLVAAVFGDEAARLARLLRTSPPRREASIVALHSDLALTRVSRLGGHEVFAGLGQEDVRALTTELGASEDQAAARADLTRRFPKQHAWLQARAYWQGTRIEDRAGLLAWLLARHDPSVQPPPPGDAPPVRLRFSGSDVSAEALREASAPVIAIVDYDAGARGGGARVHAALCEAAAKQGLACASVLARWGEASVHALQALKPARENLAALVVLQDFVLGGGEGREAANEALEALDVPVLKAVTLADRTETDYRLSDDGIPWDSVHYRVAMPELQGQSQPSVIATGGPEERDPHTGLAFQRTRVLDDQVQALITRIQRWARLRRLPNRDKRVAIVYYNHPPGRHNIGADNLDVPATLWELLRLLKKAGYTLRDVPATPEALLEEIQARGVNLPEDGPALRAMAGRVARVAGDDYAAWFASLDTRTRESLASGPLAALRTDVAAALAARKPSVARARVQGTLGDVAHLLEGADHPARARGLDLLAQLREAYDGWLGGDDPKKAQVTRLTRALTRTGIEAVRGWGPPPGDVMTVDGDLLVPGLTLGNVFVGPQPPRGWELHEELLHANLAFPPTHQYLAYYHHLRDAWKADVVIHVGRHSTYEFLPGKQVGLTAHDFPRQIIGDLPSVYLYIVDGVGEGIQAKRRGQAVIVDHLTPSLSTTPLYDDLLELRQLVESFEAQGGRHDRAAATRTVAAMRSLIDELDLRSQLTESMRGELAVRGIGFDDVDDALLVHEVGHYLTELQEQFMPFGLHVFGRAWEKPAVDRMLRSMTGGGQVDPETRRALVQSPARERASLLAALEGRFIVPGHGNDPVRTPQALPTGRNFHALDGGLLPTRVAYALGRELAETARDEGRSTPEGSEAVVLWASDTVRDEGAMVGFGLSMLGVAPVWNSRGILQGLKREPLAAKRTRRDVTFVTSGLFRDLYANLLVWLDRAVLLALDGSSETIRAAHPTLARALDGALAPLGELRAPGEEPLAQNELALHWVQDAQKALDGGAPAAKAGREATLRLFGNAPGGYGAGINRLAERSGSWDTRGQLASAYVHRMGHAYGAGLSGAPAHARFEDVLARTENTYLGRASNLYGLLDNNDGFDYLGGLGMAVESVRGAAPHARVVQHADPQRASLQSLDRALMQELRGRHLNPEYLRALMQHGYAGARTMNAGFVENLWGWQVTSPEVVKPWVWDEVQRVFLEDGHDIGLDAFLASDENVHVRTNLQAVLLVAAHKEFWSPEEATLDRLARDFAEAVVTHGLPGSGHTRPDHPVMETVAQRLNPELRARFEARLEAARVQPASQPTDPAHVRELQAAESDAADSAADGGEASGGRTSLAWGLGVFAGVALLLGLGVRRGRGPRGRS